MKIVVALAACQIALGQGTCSHVLTRAPIDPILIFRNGLLQNQAAGDYQLILGKVPTATPTTFANGDLMSLTMMRANPLSFTSQGQVVNYWGYSLWREDWKCVGNSPSSQADDWVMGFHDPAHTGTSAEIVKPPLTIAWKWKDSLPYDNGVPKVTPIQPAFFLPTYSQGRVCVQGGPNANRVFCLNAADGSQVWRSDNPGYAQNGTMIFQFSNYPAIVAGRLVYLSSDFTASVDFTTGLDYRNVYNTNGGWPDGGIAASSGAAYAFFNRTDDQTEEFNFLTDPAHIGPLQNQGMDGNYQSQNSSTTFAGGTFRVPAVDGGIAYATILSQLQAWDATTHKLLWTWGTQNWNSSPAVSNGVVFYYAQSLKQFVALKVVAGVVTTLWSLPLASAASSPIVSGGRVYVGSGDKNFYCLDAASGAVLWKFVAGAPFAPLSIPAISGSNVIVPGMDGVLYALDKMTGLEVWRYSGTAAWGPVAVGGGKIYVSDLTGTVHAFSPGAAASPKK